MRDKPKESDWKRFRKIVPDLRERYLEEKNANFVKSLTSFKKTPTERFWDTLEMMEKEERILVECLDGHSRSKQFFYMALMCRYGMLKKEDLEGFSEELRQDMERYFDE